MISFGIKDIKRMVLGLVFAVMLIATVEAYSTNTNNAATKSDYNAAIQQVNFAPYMKNLQQSIKRNWEPAKMGNSNSVTLLFRVNKKGQLVKHPNCKDYIFKSSGIKEVDKAAVKALKDTAPFEALPANFTQDYIDVQFKLDYNVHSK